MFVTGTATVARVAEAFDAFALLPHLMVMATVGSKSHGTYVPEQSDDVDLMGIVIPPLDYHFGLPRFDHWTVQIDELDVVLYSLEKMMRLLLKGNPNVLGLLWLPDDCYLVRTFAFDRLRQQRNIFFSQHVVSSFVGYAYGQLKRMETFDLARLAEYDSLVEFIGEERIKKVLEADPAQLERMAKLWHSPAATYALAEFKRFRKLHRQHFSGYLGVKRKRLVRQFGYDVRNASHLIRLLRMGLEYVETDQLNVHRLDAEELLAIKEGAWTLDQVKTEAERLFLRFDTLPRTLPAEPDTAAANDLLVALHQSWLTP
jgi:predicted nucleotidyltransferase